MATICGVLGDLAFDENAPHRMAEAAPFAGGELHVTRLGHASVGYTESSWPVEAAAATSGDLCAVFLGMFDNREEMASDLRAQGVSLPDVSAAGVLVAAFHRFGTDTPRRIRGMFSAAITDGSRLWLFRDHIGFWPLFYRFDGHQLVFATHARQVAKGAGLRLEPDLEVVERNFFRRLTDDPRCALKGIERLDPATIAVCDGTSLRHQPYWLPETLLEKGRVGTPEIRERFDQLMRRAVDRTLKGDDVVSLSGGIDSPAVAAYAAPISQQKFGNPVGALSVVYPEHPSVDESGYITEVADYLGMPYHLYPTEVKAMDHFEELMRVFDGPLPMSSLSERLAHLRKARSLGYRNMLTGELAEFVFDIRNHVLSHLLSHGRVGATVKHLRALAADGLTGRQILRRSMASVAPAPILDRIWRSQARPSVVPIPPEWLDIKAFPSPKARPIRQRWRADQLAAFGGPALAFEAEFAIQSMSGIWIRFPWADIDLWEFFLGLRAEIKYPDPRRKTLVRELIEGKVPDSIRLRTSRTFFDESITETIDYPALRSWLVDTDFRLTGVDYLVLRDRLESESLTVPGSFWAKDLASVHAFMARW